MENFPQSFQYTPSSLSDFIEFILFLQSMQVFLQLNVREKYIDRYMHFDM